MHIAHIHTHTYIHGHLQGNTHTYIHRHLHKADKMHCLNTFSSFGVLTPNFLSSHTHTNTVCGTYRDTALEYKKCEKKKKNWWLEICARVYTLEDLCYVE